MVSIFRKEKAIAGNANHQDGNYNKAVSSKNGLRISALFDRRKSQNECIMEEKKDIVIRSRKRM